MKTNNLVRLSKKIICFLSLITILVSIPGIQAEAKSTKYSVDDLEKVIDGVLAYKESQAKVTSIQDLIDNDLVNRAGVGNTEWFVIALNQYKDTHDYSKYLKALDTYVGNVKDAKATDLQRIALAYSATEGNSGFVTKTIKNTIGKLGVMSYIYGLILLDSKDYSSKDFTRNGIIKKIRALQLSEGGWALSGTKSDIDITAMAIQALAPYYDDSKVASSVNKALTYLSKQQLKTGDYKSWGNRSCESTAQVIAALAALKIDFQTDKRFIKNNKTLLNGLMLYKQKDGSFSHTIDGKANDTASVQTMYSLIAVWRQKKDLGSFYHFADIGSINTNNPITNKSETANSSSSTTNQTNTLNGNNTATIVPASDNTQTGIQLDYKVIGTILILASALFLFGMFYVMKRRNKKNFIAILAVAGIAVIALWSIKFQSVDDYYKVTSDEVEQASETAYLSIHCETVAGKTSNISIPADGIILDKTELQINEGDTVLEVLIRATKEHTIQLDYEGGEDNSLSTAYVKGIDDLYEDDFGEQSGWLYRVNGEFPGTACDEYTLSDQDVIEWVYTCNLGKDVGRE